ASRAMELVSPGLCRYLDQDRTAEVNIPIPRIGLQRGFLHRFWNGRENNVSVLYGAGYIHAIDHHHVAGITASIGADLRCLGPEIVGETTRRLSLRTRPVANYSRSNCKDVPQVSIRRRQVPDSIGG